MPVNRSFDLDGTDGRRAPLSAGAAPARVLRVRHAGGRQRQPEDAQRLARLLRGVKAKVNLIPFNDWEGASFRRPPLARILAFQSILLDAGITTTVRWSKGEDIGAACGQLRESGGTSMTRAPTVAFATLGCRLNQVDTPADPDRAGGPRVPDRRLRRARPTWSSSTRARSRRAPSSPTARRSAAPRA